MFSGIKAIFFGYPESSTNQQQQDQQDQNHPHQEETTNSTASSTAAATSQLSAVCKGFNDTKNDCNQKKLSSLSSSTTTTSSSSSSFSLETTALLNAATTKFTEQLLPQSPSIEQLQSSSHQLLPTLNEQEEATERNKNKKKETNNNRNQGASGSTSKNGDGKNVKFNKSSLINQRDETDGEKKDPNDVDNDIEEKVQEDDGDDDDDDDCEIVDSWELLDLVVEKPETTTDNSIVTGASLKSAVQEKENLGATYMQAQQEDHLPVSSGILKQSTSAQGEPASSSSSSSSSILVSTGKQPSSSNTGKKRNKQKVSFETYNLVNDQLKIENSTPRKNKSNEENRNNTNINNNNNNNVNNVSSNSASGKEITLSKPNVETIGCKKKRNKHNTKATSSKPEEKEILLGDVKETKTAKSGPIEIESKITKQTIQELVPQTNINKIEIRKPLTLNYAAALSMSKPTSNKEISTDNSKIDTNEVSSQSLVPTVRPSSGGSNLKTAKGPVKRNRPVSTSSWSSSDEAETVDLVDRKNELTIAKEENNLVNDVDVEFDIDAESVISSGFSDCDYGYEGLNDFVMRPKRAQNKKKQGSSSSSSSNSHSLLVAYSRKGNDCKWDSSSVKPGSSSSSVSLSKGGKQNESSAITKGKVTNSSKHIKPKKKKMVLSAPSNYSEFLKKRLSKEEDVDGTEPANTIPMAPPQSTQVGETTTKKTTTSSSISGNDSSDVVEMDESWYVTPPPCFTGSNNTKITKPKEKEADRENALIEHPSVYIAESSSKRQQQQPTENKKALNKKKNKQQQKDADVKELVKLSSTSPSTSKTTNDLKQQNKNKALISDEKKEIDKKHWDNKFKISFWGPDEQDDLIDDFDNLFDREEKFSVSTSSSPSPTASKSSATAKRSKKNKQQKLLLRTIENAESSTASSSDVIDGYDSDFSLTSPALVGISTESNSSSSVELIDEEIACKSTSVDKDTCIVELEMKNNDGEKENDVAQKLELVEQQSDDVVKVKDTKNTTKEKKTPTQVSPIGPERSPGWQLRRKRIRRRPLSVVATSINNGQVLGVGGKSGPSSSSKSSQAAHITPSSSITQPTDGATTSSRSNSASARSTPTLMNRFGSGIIADFLSNLTNGFQPSGDMWDLNAPEMEGVEKLNQTVVKRSNEESNLVARRCLSKSYLSRQNDCSRMANSNRRADRRLKMHTTPNGYSVNRKVHTNFH